MNTSQTGLKNKGLIAVENIAMRTITLIFAACFLNGCGHPPDEDVTLSPAYNFSSFAGTAWKTKVKIALADIKGYTGEHQLNLLAPRRFDPTVPNYASVHDAQIIEILPVGTVFRIERFMIDKGIGSDDEVKAVLENGTNSQKTVNVDPLLLAKNRFLWPGESSTNWNANPEMLERVETDTTTNATGVPAK